MLCLPFQRMKKLLCASRQGQIERSNYPFWCYSYTERRIQKSARRAFSPFVGYTLPLFAGFPCPMREAFSLCQKFLSRALLRKHRRPVAPHAALEPKQKAPEFHSVGPLNRYTSDREERSSIRQAASRSRAASIMLLGLVTMEAVRLGWINRLRWTKRVGVAGAPPLDPPWPSPPLQALRHQDQVDPAAELVADLGQPRDLGVAAGGVEGASLGVLRADPGPDRVGAARAGMRLDGREQGPADAAAPRLGASISVCSTVRR